MTRRLLSLLDPVSVSELRLLQGWHYLLSHNQGRYKACPAQDSSKVHA